MKQREFRMFMAIGEWITRIVEAISDAATKRKERKHIRRMKKYERERKRWQEIHRDEPEYRDISND